MAGSIRARRAGGTFGRRGAAAGGSGLGPRILDVATVTAYIKQLFDADPILSDIWIRGEVSNFTRSSAGHLYFSLKAEGAELPCVLFKGSALRLTFFPGNGDAVLAHGNMSIYEARGRYQLYVDELQPEGTGLLQLQFQALRAKLEREGFFDEARKRPLPAYPRVIGVVTSATGAVWHDIQSVLRRRYPLCELILAPTLVQGDEAPAMIVRALEALQLDGRAELIVVARGGGSMEDLWCFNDEQVARAVFACRVPVVSAIGHETDYTICDYVADVRAPTPSAAAEVIAPHVREMAIEVAGLYERLEGAARERLRLLSDDTASWGNRLQRHSPQSQIRQERLRLDGTTDRMARLLESRLATERRSLIAADRQLRLLHPAAIMERGFAMVTDPQTGRRLGAAAALSPEQAVDLTFHDGHVGAVIKSVAIDRRRQNEE